MHDHTETVDNLVKEYKEVFQEGYGTVKGFQAKIWMERDSTPIFG